jgi:hypothetical protein
MSYDQTQRLKKARASRDIAYYPWYSVNFFETRIFCLYKLLAKVQKERDEARAALADMAIELHRLKQK